MRLNPDDREVRTQVFPQILPIQRGYYRKEVELTQDDDALFYNMFEKGWVTRFSNTRAPVVETFRGWKYSFDTDLSALGTRQQVMKYLLENPSVREAIANQVPCRDREHDHDEYKRYLEAQDVFEAMSTNVPLVRDALAATKHPPVLSQTFSALSKLEEELILRKSKLDNKYSGVLTFDGKITKREWNETYSGKIDLEVTNLTAGTSYNVRFSERERTGLEYVVMKLFHIPREEAKHVRGMLSEKESFLLIEGKPQEIVFDGQLDDILSRRKMKDNFNGVHSYFLNIAPDYFRAMAELMVMSAAADFMANARANGISIAFPELRPVAERSLQYEQMGHPTLYLVKGPEKVVHNDVKLGSANELAVITGANFNGKTTYMNAIALNQVLAQMGMPVFAKSAILSPRDDIVRYQPRTGTASNGQSNFSGELQGADWMFKQAQPASLILIDEPFTGTSPEDARTVLQDRFMEGLFYLAQKHPTSILLSTHFHDVADTITQRHPTIHKVGFPLGKDPANPHTYKAELGALARESEGVFLADSQGLTLDSLKKIADTKKY